MSKPPPIRQDPTLGAPAPIAAEVQAQIDARQQRRREEHRRQRPKATYDLPLAIQAGIEQVVERESIARSDVVALALVRFLADYRAGEIEMSEHKVPARSLRYRYKVELPPEFE